MREIAGFHDVPVHGVLGIDTEIVWDVVENELAVLIEGVEQLPDQR